MSLNVRKKLPMRFPLWHLPYLEKHRIYELFHEIARELVIHKPSDHVLFTKQILLNAARSRDIPRIIFLPSPKINLIELATEISKITKQVVISRQTLIGCLNKDFNEVKPEVLAKALSYLVRQENCYLQGWIIVDCFRNADDAKNLLQLGIIPTHTFHLIAPFHPNIDDILYCKVAPHWPEQRRLLVVLRNIFKNSLREVHIKHRHMAEIIAEIIEISKIRKMLRQVTPRVLLLGPRGSGRKTQAQILAYNLNLVYIDFEYLLCQAWISPSELGKKLRECQNEACFHSELLVQVVNKRILHDDCLLNGYILTGFPFTDTDFKYFDSLDTPPNRVIFIECDLNVCRERIRYRRLNVATGSAINIKENPSVDKELVLHPKDDIHMVNAELNYYCQNYGSLRKYCGATANIVNGDLSERAVTETITAIILRAEPAAPPRKGLSPQDMKSSSSSSDDSCGCPVVSSKIMDCFIKQL